MAKVEWLLAPWQRAGKAQGCRDRVAAQAGRRALGHGVGAGPILPSPAWLQRVPCFLLPAQPSRPQCNEAGAVLSSTPLRCGCFQLSGPFVPSPGRVPLSATSSHCPGPMECKSSRARGKRRFPAGARSQHRAAASMQADPIDSHPMSLLAVSLRPPVTARVAAGCCGDRSQSSTAPLRAPTHGAGEEGPPARPCWGPPCSSPTWGVG